jgi:prevent-host-death family protein
MKEIGIHELRTHWARILERAKDGERITITRHGVPVALLVPFKEEPELETSGSTKEDARLKPASTKARRKDHHEP